MMEKGKMERDVVELVDTESLVPQEHLLWKVDKAVDFRKLYEIVEPLSSEEDGRPRRKGYSNSGNIALFWCPSPIWAAS